jgi:hypothetical protein
MSYKRLSLIIPLVLILSLVFIGAASAAATASQVTDCSNSPNFMSKMYCTWLGGLNSTNLDLSGELIKWLFLVLIIVLIYSAFSYAKFPENAGLRVLLSIVTAFLATFLLTQAELFTAIQSYSAMGVALIIFLPILILAFFTMIVASKAAPFGILLQKVLWLVYAVFLLFKTMTLWILVQCQTNGGCENSSFTKFLYDYIVVPLTSKTSLIAMKAQVAAGQYDTAMLLLLVIVSIFVLTITMTNKFVVHWFAHEKYFADIEHQEDIIKRSQKLRETEAKATRGEEK